MQGGIWRIGLGVLLGAALLAGLFVLVWRDGQRAPPAWLRGLPGPEAEAAFCLAVAERIDDRSRGADARLARFLDEQILFWRGRAGSALGAGRAALAAETADPTRPEDRALFLALQDCAWRALSFYGHRFPSMEEGGL
ncbi:hypothetical protein [Fuscovulum blasticum]|uniref:hypothetical protein n=1 Tax=Fuscovulum blasticum TaxID=1075 RepID=UPI000D3EC1FB|nr:hypothetical protein [Fuscovulum blasticum]AWD20961.1 hypothetical protein B6K69_04155 [Fuscovulum blasticum]